MVESIVPQPRVPTSGHHLILFDPLKHRPDHPFMFQGRDVKSVVFPVLDLVKKRIYFPRLNHSVLYIRLQSNYPVYEAS